MGKDLSDKFKISILRQALLLACTRVSAGPLGPELNDSPRGWMETFINMATADNENYLQSLSMDNEPFNTGWSWSIETFPRTFHDIQGKKMKTSVGSHSCEIPEECRIFSCQDITPTYYLNLWNDYEGAEIALEVDAKAYKEIFESFEMDVDDCRTGASYAIRKRNCPRAHEYEDEYDDID